MGFNEQVYAVVAQIPRGKVVTYGDIAKWLGRPRSARIVGFAMANCPEELPWQRVVMADGGVTGGEWAELRRELLRDEGVSFTEDGRVDMKTSRWIPPPDINKSFFGGTSDD